MSLRFLPLFLLVGPTPGQDYLVTKFQPARVSVHDGTTGDLLNDTFIDVNGLVGLGGSTTLLWEAVVPGNGEIWVANYSHQAVHRFTDDGLVYLGDFPTSRGRALGMAIAANTVWVCSESGPFGEAVVWYDEATLAMTGSTPSAKYPYDTLAFQNQLLVSFTTGTIELLDTATGAYVGTFSTPGGFLEQMAETAAGNLLVGQFSPAEVHELDSSGNLLVTYGIPGVGFINGVAELGNGQLLVSGGAGTYRFDPSTGTSTLVDGGGTGGYIAFDTPTELGAIGTSYCGPANLNSSGLSAVITAYGSEDADANKVRLDAVQMAVNKFGYFINSQTQGFVANPGGSQGNLCLGGGIGRYTASVMNTGGGEFSLQLDLNNTPTPSGAVVVMAGETWNFQAWFRDVNPTNTSNFTDGVSILFE